RESPSVVGDGGRAAAAQRLLAIEQLGLELVIAGLHPAALVVEGDDLLGRKSHGIEERGEQHLGSVAGSLVGDGTSRIRPGQGRVALARLVGNRQFYECVAGAHLMENAPARAGTRADQPVTLAAAAVQPE